MDLYPTDLFTYVNDGGSLSVLELKAMGRGVLRGLSALHANNHIHRDLKPENILMRGFDTLDSNTYVLSDFGLTCKVGLWSTAFTGTPEFLAPECIWGTICTPKVDMWAFGVLLYNIITSKFPLSVSRVDDETSYDHHNRVISVLSQYAASSPHHVIPFPSGVDRETRRIIKLLLRANPLERPTADQALADPYFL